MCFFQPEIQEVSSKLQKFNDAKEYVMKVNSKNKVNLWKRSQIQVFFIKRNVLCLLLLVTIPKRDRIHGWQSLQPDYWLVPSRLLLFVSGHGTIVGDYYGIWCEGDDGKMKGGKEESLRFPPSHHPSRFSWPRFSN